MALTVSDILTQSRELLQDKVSPYRYSDEAMIFAINEALFEAMRLRPDLFTAEQRRELTRLAATDDVLPLPQIYFAQLVNYVVGRCEMREDEFATDKRAATLLSAFFTALVRGA